MRTTDAPFSVRPTEGTALKRIRDARRAKGQSMKPILERWAELHERRNEEKQRD